jgi:hypothetical protein
MMDRSLRHRLSKIDKHIATARKERKKKNEQHIRDLLFSARHHATAVAAIVLSGQPKIDEPLIMAWNRALQHYGINLDTWGGMDDQVEAAEQLDPMIMQGKEASARFTEIFAAAPVWLLQFTGLLNDARLLKFDLPDMPKLLSWGSAGFEDAQRWPLLPLGTMTAGDPIPSRDPRQLWLIPFCVVRGGGDLIQFLKSRPSGEEEEIFCSTGEPLFDAINSGLLLWAEAEAQPEREWSPHERRHVRKMAERISRLMEESQQQQRSRRR